MSAQKIARPELALCRACAEEKLGGHSAAGKSLSAEKAKVMSIFAETKILVRDIPAHMPKRNGKRLHLATMWRWIGVGIRGVKLETILIGGMRYTSLEAIERFIESINSGSAVVRSSSQRQKAIADAEAACEAAGA